MAFTMVLLGIAAVVALILGAIGVVALVASYLPVTFCALSARAHP